ncbi:MAG: LysM peptidoglycan-binding domain-containing protein [Deltaproteobacteria bacterium]|nr:LysM peptidoglycan-binding domain-containing protein [Deltaproteobacteria bacterium]
MTRILISLLVTLLVGACAPTHTSRRERQEYFTHTVGRHGENLGSIARWYTGSSSNWEFLLRHNPGLDPQRIQTGDVVRIPKAWLITTKPMPSYTSRRPTVRRPAPVYPGPDPTHLEQLDPVHDDQGQTTPPADQVPPAQDQWNIETPVVERPLEPSQTIVSDPESEERRRRIRDRLLDDMLQ